jgi:4-hydroxy-2-oxoheptanedioate aldolase
MVGERGLMGHATTIGALAKRIGGGSGLLTAWVGMPEPLVAGQLALEDFDAVTLDMQHGVNDIHSVRLGVAQVTLAGKPTIIRIPVGEFSTASRVLDLGVAGVIAPMINSKEDATSFAKFMKYPPLGERSWGPTIAFGLTGTEGNDYLKAANATSLAIAMVETREALAALDDILATPGIDAVFVGPSDLSIALSHGAHVDPSRKDVADALDHVVARCRAHKKSACCFAPSPSAAVELKAKGYDLMAIGTDFSQLRSGARAQIAIARGTV